MNLSARPVPSHGSDLPGNGILLTMRPACLLSGEYSYETNGDSLLRMLRRQTDLPLTILEKFEREICSSKGATLLAVEIGEEALTEIGYFVD
jgi:hypothetical protein